MEARRGWPSRGGGKKLVRDRAALARLLWDPSGKRRLPSTAALDRALARLPRSELEWIFEFNPLAPLYLLPTSEWVRALAKSIERLGPGACWRSRLVTASSLRRFAAPRPDCASGRPIPERGRSLRRG